MEDSKAWYASKGVWGGVVALLAGVAGALGYNVPADMQGDIVNWVVGLAGVAGGAVALWGRIKASSKIK